MKNCKNAEKITKKENLIEEVNILSTQKYQQIMNELILESGIKSNKGILKYEYETDLGTTKDIETEIKLLGMTVQEAIVSINKIFDILDQTGYLEDLNSGIKLDKIE